VVSSLQPPGDRVDSYVLPILRVTQTRPTTSRVLGVSGTGFLLADGHGLGITAGHVAKNLEAAVGEREYPAVAFRQAAGARSKIVPVAKFERHPTEDVALFRLVVAEDFTSPYTVSATPHAAPTDYMLWGYPDDIHHDRTAEGGTLQVDMVYSAGHIRRQVSYELPINSIPGQRFYELSSPAGSCCSGAPINARTPGGAFDVIAVYVGERRNEANTFAVGYATRSEALVTQWPQLVNGGSDLSALCVP
jgi:hypothetical protein